MNATQTRRTSNYTVRFANSPEGQGHAARFASALSVPVQDHGATAITFRSADDASATETATAALSAAGITAQATLTTGLGVHRRTVAVQDEAPEPAPAETFLALAHMGANHATKPGTYDPRTGFAAALCRSTLPVSVEHGAGEKPVPADEDDLSCHSCVKALRRLRG